MKSPLDMGAQERFEAVGLDPMQSLTLTITRNCNLSCEHCWPMCGSATLLPPVATFVLHRIIDGFAGLGIREICLTGGEPLTHPDWPELIRAVCDQPTIQQARLQTNATLIDEQIARLLADSGLTKLLIEISMDGATAASHDRVRGLGNHQRTLQGIQALCRAGLGGRTIVAFTEMAHNMHELPQLLSDMKRLGVSKVVSGTLVMSGRASQSLLIRPPDPGQYRALLDRYHQDKAFRIDYAQIGNIAGLEWLAGRASETPFSCRCARMPYITADGQLYPCVLLPLERYGVPGAFSRPLGDVLQQAAVLWRDLPQWYERRLTGLEACFDCIGRGHCGGGCLGRAIGSAGDFMQVEDRCALRQVVYHWKAPAIATQL